jgi:uncharacterized protein
MPPADAGSIVPRAVLDTNVVVSALLWGGTPFVLLSRAVDGDLVLCTSPVLIEELREVLTRSHLVSRLESRGSSAERAVALSAGLTVSVSPSAVPRVVPADIDDDHVVAAAIAAEAGLIVTGDRHLLTLGSHQGIRIVTPADALEILARDRDA